MKTYALIDQHNYCYIKNEMKYISHRAPHDLVEAKVWAALPSPYSYTLVGVEGFRKIKLIESDEVPSCEWGFVLYVWDDIKERFVYVGDDVDSSG